MGPIEMHLQIWHCRMWFRACLRRFDLTREPDAGKCLKRDRTSARLCEMSELGHSRRFSPLASRPLRPHKRPERGRCLTSHSCQERTSLPQNL
jgi:hypothetical protein